MILWLSFAALGLLTILAFRRPWFESESSEQTDPFAPIKAQLLDLEADHKAGTLGTEAYSRARIELERRLLRLHKSTEKRPALERLGANKLASICGALIAVVAVGLYVLLGSPSQPAKLGARTAMADVPLQEDGPTLAEARSAIEDRLENAPDDIEALGMLMRVTTALQDHGATGQVAQRLIALQPENPAWYVEALNAYLRSSQGRMTPGARLLLQNFSTAHPGHPFAAFHTARMQAIDGDREASETTLMALAERSDPNDPWMVDVGQALAALRGERPAPTQRPGPTEADVAAVEAMSEEDRATFIASMVERLADRLQENPDDPAGWVQLARARFVQSGAGRAVETLEEAIEKNPANAERYGPLLDRLKETGDF